MILIDMLQVNKLQEDFRSSNSGIAHQNVHWHLETLSDIWDDENSALLLATSHWHPGIHDVSSFTLIARLS